MNYASMRIDASTLHGIDVFRNLGIAERRRLAERCHCHRFAPHSIVLSRCDRHKNVYFIIAGQARAVEYSPAGHEVALTDLRAGEMFGELAAIDGGARSADVIAKLETLVAVMSGDDFWAAVLRHPALAQALIKRLAGRVRELTERVVEMNTLGAKGRVHAELIRLAEAGFGIAEKVVISPAPTHQELANRVGVRRETVTREFLQLKRMGLVERRGRDLVVRDIGRLGSLME